MVLETAGRSLGFQYRQSLTAKIYLPLHRQSYGSRFLEFIRATIRGFAFQVRWQALGPIHRFINLAEPCVFIKQSPPPILCHR